MMILSLLFLASIAVDVAGSSEVGVDAFRRRLSYEKIAGYSPGSLVTSQNALDLDQREFQAQLALGTSSGFETAMRIYKEGAFSEPVAVLNLTTPLNDILSIGDEVIGVSQGGVREVKGHIFANYPKGTRKIMVKYDQNEMQSSYVGCQVAANPNPVLDGCFANDGLLVITGYQRSISYNYNQLKDNVSDRSMAQFSKDARLTMELCMHCPFEDYLKFRTYYGAADYADQWIQAASEGRRTDFSHGNADFRMYEEEGKYEAMSKASAYMNIWMYVIREMEDALDDCEFQEDIDSGVHSWDEAVAFYTGSLEGQEGLGDGVMIYNLADKRCQDFKTCGLDSNSEDGTSYVNLQIFDEFKVGLGKLRKGDCSGARSNKERIVQLMTIPLVQGTLRYAHFQGTGEDTTQKAEAEGAIFAATILPIIHACDGDGNKNAAIIYENMKTGHKPTDFRKVKKALERSYRCLRITCAEVGGVWDEISMTYKVHASPCIGDGSPNEGSTANVGLAVGLAIGGFSCVLLIVAVTSVLGKKPAPVPTMPPPSEIL